MMAYLAMMAVRLIELHRVLKPTGSLYLHCDPTASHYLKVLLDCRVWSAMFSIMRLSGNEARSSWQCLACISATYHDSYPLLHKVTRIYLESSSYAPYIR